MAPKISLDVSPMPEHEDLLSGLSDGSIDAVIGNWPRPPQHLRMASILTTDIVCLVRPSHPFTRRTDRIRMEEYLLEKHLSPTSRRHAHLSPIDGRLIELGLTRQISATVPEYAIAPNILAQSNLLFTTGRHFAEQVPQTCALTRSGLCKHIGITLQIQHSIKLTCCQHSQKLKV